MWLSGFQGDIQKTWHRFAGDWQWRCCCADWPDCCVFRHVSSHSRIWWLLTNWYLGAHRASMTCIRPNNMTASALVLVSFLGWCACWLRRQCCDMLCKLRWLWRSSIKDWLLGLCHFQGSPCGYFGLSGCQGLVACIIWSSLDHAERRCWRGPRTGCWLDEVLCVPPYLLLVLFWCRVFLWPCLGGYDLQIQQSCN